MNIRMTLFSLAAALLYLGPLVAGLSSAPIALLPVFVAIFVLWVAILRPSVWSKATSGGTPVALAVHLGGLTLMQVLLVILAFALGRGLSTLVGVLDLPVWLPVLVSLAAVPVGRMLWNPALDNAEADAFLDEAVRSVNGTDARDRT
jgi:hypothetical protein